MSTVKSQEQWTEKHISTFWDWVSQSKHWQSRYFTKQVGLGVKNFMFSKIKFHGKYLDYGCGSGNLIDLIIACHEVNCYGLEHSPLSQNKVNVKFQDDKNWHGCELIATLPSRYKENQFDVITFIETVEHLKDEMLNATISELNRILKPGGRLVVTTPYNENLIDNHVYCPFCDSEFHRMQHMRSFDVTKLSQTFCSFGFKTIYCNNVNFGKWDSSRNRLRYSVQSILSSLKIKSYQHNNKPHLVGIFTKLE